MSGDSASWTDIPSEVRGWDGLIHTILRVFVDSRNSSTTAADSALESIRMVALGTVRHALWESQRRQPVKRLDVALDQALQRARVSRSRFPDSGLKAIRYAVTPNFFDSLSIAINACTESAQLASANAVAYADCYDRLQALRNSAPKNPAETAAWRTNIANLTKRAIDIRDQAIQAAMASARDAAHSITNSVGPNQKMSQLMTQGMATYQDEALSSFQRVPLTASLDGIMYKVMDGILSAAMDATKSDIPRILHCRFDAVLDGFCELQYYRSFYDDLKWFVTGEDMKHWNICGSPGIGKSTFIIFLVFWWVHEHESSKWSRFGKEIDTIIIDRTDKGGSWKGDYLIRKVSGGVEISSGYGILGGTKISSNNDLVRARSFQCETTARVTGFGSDGRKVEFFNTPSNVAIDTDSTFYIVDGMKHATWSGQIHTLVVQSLARDRQEDSSTKIETIAPLPTEEEMETIRCRCLRDSDQADLFEKFYGLCGPNIRECLENNWNYFRRAYSGALSKLNLEALNLGEIAEAVVDSRNARRFFFQLQVKRGPAPYRLSTCRERHWGFSCRGSCLATYYWLLKKRGAEANNLMNLMNSILGEGYGRGQLGQALEVAFGFLGPQFEIKTLARSVTFTNHRRIERTYGEWECLTLVGGTESGTPVSIDGLPYIFPEDHECHQREVFFKAPRNNDLFDFASVCGRTVNLFQVTVSDRHSVRLGSLASLKGFTSVNFFMVRVAMCPKELEEFKEGKGVTPIIGNAEERKRFAAVLIQERGMNYYECIWPLFEASMEWTDHSVMAACGLDAVGRKDVDPMLEIVNDEDVLEPPGSPTPERKKRT
jgi:hypothetical protein